MKFLAAGVLFLYCSYSVTAGSVKVSEITEERTIRTETPHPDIDLNGVKVDVTYYPEVEAKKAGKNKFKSSKNRKSSNDKD